MTVTASTRKAGPYAGNGVATSFPFYFKVFDKTGLQVVLTDADGVATTLVIDSDYSVTLSSDQDAAPGGTITYPIIGSPMAAGLTLTAIGGTTYDQATDITNAGRFLPQVIENALDKVTILIQQLKEVSDRTLQAAIGTTVKLLFPAPSSGKFLRWRTDLTGLENADGGTDSMALQGLLADATLAARGAGMIGYGSNLAYTNGTVGAKLNQVLSVKDMPYNAIGDGVADDTAAVQAALSAAVLAKKVLFFPAGSYRLTARLVAAGAVTIRGESRATTKLIWPSAAATEGIDIALSGVGHYSDICDVTSIQLRSGNTTAAGTALRITGSNSFSGDRETSRAVIRDLVIGNLTDSFTDGWGIGIDLVNCMNSLIDSFTFWGKVDSVLNLPFYDSQFAVKFTGTGTPHAVAFTVTNSFITLCQTGVRCYDFEGALIRGNQIVGVNTGVLIDNPAVVGFNYPHVSILDNHINANESDLTVARTSQAIIHGNLLYLQLGNTTGQGISILGTSDFFSIKNNTFDNVKTSVAGNMIVVSSGSKGQISGNIFSRSDSVDTTVGGLAIWLTAGASECAVYDNTFFLSSSTNGHVFDQGTLNNVQDSGAAVTGDAWWSTTIDGRTRQWGSRVVTLNASGFGTITLPKTYLTQHENAVVVNGDATALGANVFARSTLALNAVNFAVFPNPGAVNVRVDFDSHGR